jgi:membrane-associated phospholipid phosphatase
MIAAARLSRRSRVGTFAAASAACVLAFVVVAALVRTGVLRPIDDYAIRHLMPFRSTDQGGSSVFGTLLSYHDLRFHAGRVLRLPAGALLSTVGVVLACATLLRGGRTRLALLWALAFAAANIVELGCKLVVTKSVFLVFSRGETILVGFRHSFPSGHTVRALILAAVLATLWPRLRFLLAAWVVAVVVTLELDGIHTPSDIAGGLLLGVALILAVHAAEQEAARRGLPSHFSFRAAASGVRAAPGPRR